MEVITATIERITYTNPANGFTIIRAVPEGRMMLMTASLKIIDPNVGMCLKMQGDWKSTKQYGDEFVVEEWEEILPSTTKGIEAYLASGMIKGIGPVFARKIVEYFKEDSLRILSEEPDRLYEIKGMGKKKCESIKEEWKRQENIREIMMFFKQYNLSTNLIIKINNKYGTAAIEMISENPYRITYDIEGAGFKIADSIAIRMGFALDSPLRIESGVIYKMREICDDGDTYSTREDILEKSAYLLDIDESYIEPVINSMINSGKLVDDDGAIYLPSLYMAEKDTAERFALKAQYGDEDDSEIDFEKLEQITGIEYDELQKDAIRTATENNVMVLTGGPGTGKTTVTRGIIELLSARHKTISLAAPTGKAAKRISELTGKMAMTIHRLLEYNPALGYQRNEYNPLHDDVLIVDEASMINIELMHNLIKAVPKKMKLIIIGDIDQLPCIGSGNVLRDIIDSGKVPVVRLNKIYRQAQNSNIIVNAHRVRNGESLKVDNNKDSDFFFMKEPDDMMALIISLIRDRLPNAFHINPEDIQVLTPMKKNEVGTINLNNEIQKTVNPVGDEVKHGFVTFRIGDKVIQNINDYEKDVFNGDSGTVLRIDNEDKKLVVRYDDKDVEYAFHELDEIMLAYAMTIHKSQGSEYPVVIIPITYANRIMMQRNLIYTAITRAKKMCIIVGPKAMIDKAISSENSYFRRTKLKERICECVDKGLFL